MIHYETKTKGKITRIRIVGKILSRADAEPLLETIDGLIQAGKTKLILDLSGTSFLNSEGLNALLKILTLCRKEGGDCLLCRISDELNQLFIMTKLNQIFTVTSTLKEAEENLKEIKV
jgi:anti-sigma B factor antagonist